jgi:acrylyl-CoA reductase (NADPH)
MAVKLPPALTLKQSMAYGTAGFTAALCVMRLMAFGLTKDSGEVLITGATGGVGSVAVGLLSKLGFNVVAPPKDGREGVSHAPRCQSGYFA